MTKILQQVPDRDLLLKEDKDPEIVHWTEKHTIDCIHELHWVNQGLTGCNLGLDPSKCNQCLSKEPKEYLCQCSATSTGVINYI